MYKIEGTAIGVSPQAIDFDILQFASEYEATEYLTNQVLTPSFVLKDGKYYLDSDSDYYYEITGSREWFPTIYTVYNSNNGKTETFNNFKAAENSILSKTGDYELIDDKYVGDSVEYWIKERTTLNAFNPCKLESGKVGEVIHDTISNIHTKFTELLSPNIDCECCKKVNYTTLKYGLLMLFLPFIPYISFVGFFLVVVALSLRNFM